MGKSATDLKFHNAETVQFRCQDIPSGPSYPIIGDAVTCGSLRDRRVFVALLHQR